ncbi:MAG: hypothetical protein A2152_01680 [Candidatus Levybacteria bacterium RBG_16_35_6]|nr:MAG: hypothetical protein A2152_01680 [Candidatus Levybacteria bacterium RBG_16_35_6]
MVLIEATFTTVPIVLLLLISFLVLEKKSWVFSAAFFSGLALDILSLRFLGSTSLYFIIVLFIINLYERRFETANIYFVLFASFIGSFFYLTVFDIRFAFPQALFSAFLGSLIFFLISILSKKEKLGYKYRIGK